MNAIYVCRWLHLNASRCRSSGPTAIDNNRRVVKTFGATAFRLERILAAKAGRTVTVCIPAHDEEATVGTVVEAVAGAHLSRLGGSGLVDEVLVVDDGSKDRTGDVAAAAGADVHRLEARTGKGGAMRAGVEAASGDLLVFLDADVENTTGAWVTSLLGPLVTGDVALVKGFYQRPLGGSPTGGGRVTELLARPLLDVVFPELSDVRQPLAGETATHRWVLEKVGLAAGYGVEIALLLDVATHLGVGAIAQVDLGSRLHRNRPLDELRPMAAEVLRAAWARAPGAPAAPTGPVAPTGETGR